MLDRLTDRTDRTDRTDSADCACHQGAFTQNNANLLGVGWFELITTRYTPVQPPNLVYGNLGNDTIEELRGPPDSS